MDKYPRIMEMDPTFVGINEETRRRLAKYAEPIDELISKIQVVRGSDRMIADDDVRRFVMNIMSELSVGFGPVSMNLAVRCYVDQWYEVLLFPKTGKPAAFMMAVKQIEADAWNDYLVDFRIPLFAHERGLDSSPVWQGRMDYHQIDDRFGIFINNMVVAYETLHDMILEVAP